MTWADTLLKPAEEILDKVKDVKYHKHTYVFKEEDDKNTKSVKVIRCKKSNYHKKTPSHLIGSLNKPTYRSKTGVRGVYIRAPLDDGTPRYEAQIQKGGVARSLYWGPSLEEAIAARKKGEEDRDNCFVFYTGKDKEKNKSLPAGVTKTIKNGKISYHAMSPKNTHLYHGKDLTMAVNCRKKWEEENGFINPENKRCVGHKTTSSKNKSGHIGVYRDKRTQNWIATGGHLGKNYIFYIGPSKISAIRERERWEKDKTKNYAAYSINGAKKRDQYLKMFRGNKDFTSESIHKKYNISLHAASNQLSRMYSLGYLTRRKNPDNKRAFIYTRNRDM